MDKLWTIHFSNHQAEEEILSLSADLKAKFIHVSELVIEFGPQHIGMPHVRFIEGKIWEMRLKGKNTIARSFYFASSDCKIIILHTFIKKTQKTPAKEITIAKKRLKEYQDEQN